MFYIAKARIDKVSGASATIGVCVWITLAAWLVTGILGCVIGVGNCCTACTRRDQATSRKSRYEAMEQDHHQQRRDDDDAKRRETEIPTTIPKLYGDDDDYKMNHYGSQQRSVQPESFIDGVGYGYGHRARTSEEHLLNNGQPRQVTPPPTDRGYVPSATAYPLTRSPQPPQPYGDPYAASHPEEMLASHSSGSAVQNPYGNTPFPASSSNNLAPGPPTNLHRSMTPASTYAGSFVGVGSGRHDGMPMPAMPENAVAGAAAYGATGGAAAAAGGMYAAGRQVRQRSGHEAQQPCE
ncbi:hypothetical protein QFC19_001756 [Naganishia cerealis]|uniref:Uncharacterized protein n=1 Tax=Naganishia cerealis TaxID=610337 RepID=A0ACC2WG08_9TREE|nr:hypothetical protein QFC19_001756 [Naganishia cerealis]